jgi:hypothetical protein
MNRIRRTAVTEIASDRPSKTVLHETEVIRRVTLLTELQAALAALGIQSMLVRNRRLVLRSASSGLERSGPTDPQLHVFADDGTEIVTTDGALYQFSGGPACLVSDPSAAAAGLASRLDIDPQEQPL